MQNMSVWIHAYIHESILTRMHAYIKVFIYLYTHTLFSHFHGYGSISLTVLYIY